MDFGGLDSPSHPKRVLGDFAGFSSFFGPCHGDFNVGFVVIIVVIIIVIIVVIISRFY